MVSDAFLSSLGLQLVGPYDVLAGKTKRHAASGCPNYLCHWRYYYDPPEFLTVVRGDDKKQFHLGYYRYVVSDTAVMPAAFVVVWFCVRQQQIHVMCWWGDTGRLSRCSFTQLLTHSVSEQIYSVEMWWSLNSNSTTFSTDSKFEECFKRFIVKCKFMEKALFYDWFIYTESQRVQTNLFFSQI